MPNDHSLKHSIMMFDMEKWSLFGSLPNILKLDEGLKQLIVNMNCGVIDLDKLALLRHNEAKPSLWGYYTLPKWAREDNFVRNTMMALEYHQPSMTLR